MWLTKSCWRAWHGCTQLSKRNHSSDRKDQDDCLNFVAKDSSFYGEHQQCEANYP